MGHNAAMRILRAANHRRMPWKNGGGETIEIAVEPPEASLETFAWRVSLARVAVDGPFSQFAGIDRTLAVIEGAGIVLSIEGREHALSVASEPLSFAGDSVTTSRLVDGPIRDLNVMTRRGSYRHALVRHDAATPIEVGAPGIVTLVLARQPLSVGGELLEVDDVAIGEAMVLAPAGGRLVAYVIELKRT